MNKNHEAIFNCNVPRRAVCVWLYLKYRAGKDGSCFPSVRKICMDLRMSRSTVHRALADLTKAGFLQREAQYHKEGGRRSSIYHLQ